MQMKITLKKHQLFSLLLLLVASSPIYAVSAVSNINVKVTRFLSITNTSEMSFGGVSVNSTAGTVTLNFDGVREANGGVVLNDSASFSPAKFLIEGARNSNYSISFPQEVVMTDGFGNTLVVDEVNSQLIDAGQSGINGLHELVVGARLNLEAYQASGAYQGSLVVDIEYQ